MVVTIVTIVIMSVVIMCRFSSSFLKIYHLSKKLQSHSYKSFFQKHELCLPHIVER